MLIGVALVLVAVRLLYSSMHEGRFLSSQERPQIGFGLNASEARTSGKYGISFNRVRNYWQFDGNHPDCSRDRPSLS